MKSIVAIMLFLFLVGSSYAAPVNVGNSITIDAYFPTSHGVHFMMVGNQTNPAGCASDTWYVLPTDIGEYEEYKKLLLIALESNKTISLWVHDDQCLTGFPKVFSFVLNRV